MASTVPARGVGSLELAMLEREFLDLNAVEHPRRVRLGIDSGAAVTVWPTKLCDDYPTEATRESTSGVKYFPAGAGSSGISGRGSRKYRMMDKFGQDVSMTVHVADVRKPLVSVADINDKGLDVILPADGNARIVDNKTGKEITIERSNGVFEVVADVVPFANSSGFGRQAML
jgi:hypothetical protein